jgi:uncharacterized protein (TIGR02246 family)
MAVPICGFFSIRFFSTTNGQIKVLLMSNIRKYIIDFICLQSSGIACRLFLIACLLGVFPAGASMAQSNNFKGGSAADYASMKAQLEGVIDAYNAADPEAFKSAYTEDAWVISMRRPIKASREEIGAAFTPGMAQYLFETNLEILDIEVHGDIAYMIGRSTLTGEPREGAAVPAFVEERIYTAIFKRQNDAWLIHRHMESTSPRENE